MIVVALWYRCCHARCCFPRTPRSPLGLHEPISDAQLVTRTSLKFTFRPAFSSFSSTKESVIPSGQQEEGTVSFSRRSVLLCYTRSILDFKTNDP